MNCYHRKLNLMFLTIWGCTNHISAAKWRKKTWHNINIRKRCFLPSLSKKTNYSGQCKQPSEELRDISQKFLRLFTVILERSGVLFQVILGYPPSSAYVVVRDPKWCHLSQTGVWDNTASNTLPSKRAQVVCHNSISTNTAPEGTHHTFLYF